VRRQLVQPGCQYTLIGSPAGTVGPVMIVTVVADETLTLPPTRNNRASPCAGAIKPRLLSPPRNGRVADRPVVAYGAGGRSIRQRR